MRNRYIYQNPFLKKTDKLTFNLKLRLYFTDENPFSGETKITLM